MEPRVWSFQVLQKELNIEFLSHNKKVTPALPQDGSHLNTISLKAKENKNSFNLKGISSENSSFPEN